jgi:hypothetical protein
MRQNLLGDIRMPSSAVHTFTDPEEYAAVFPATSAELTITGRGQFIASVTRIELHRLWMLRYSDNLPRIKHSTNITGRTIIAFRTQHGPGLFFNGKEMHPGNIKQLGPGQSDNQQSGGLASVGVMSLPVEDMASVGKAIAGIELGPPRDGLIVTPPTAPGSPDSPVAKGESGNSPKVSTQNSKGTNK